IGQHLLQLIEADEHIGLARRIVYVLGRGAPAAEIAEDALRRVSELAGAGPKDDRLRQRLERGPVFRDRAEDLELELRNAVAEGFERQILEDNVSEAEISGGRALALDRLDRTIGGLIIRSGMNAEREAGGINQLAVRPDASDARDRTFAERN